MPEDARYLRTRLEMEFSRLRTFSVISGLAEYDEGDALPQMLRPHKTLLFAVLTEIEHSMNQIANINGEFVELQPTTNPTSVGTDDELAQGFSNVTISYQKTATEKKRWKGFNHFGRFLDMTENVAKKPQRLKWVAFKEKVFIKFLERLTLLNSYLEDTIRGHQEQLIEDTVQKTYLEMVQMKTTVQELLQLQKAAQLFLPPVEIDRPRPTPENAADVSRARPADRMLVSLANSKGLRVAADVKDGQRLPILEEATQQTEIAFTQMRYDQPSTTKGVRVRNEGVYKASEASENGVWIEWRDYRLVSSDDDPNRVIPFPKNLVRVKELAALLQSATQPEFCMPKCLGWFDDRDYGKQYGNASRFGLVFEKPAHGKTPITLSELINTHPKPSLTDRMKLTHIIARCLLHLHAVDWLHKGLRSDSIIFVPTNSTTDLTRPYVTGYEYARPDKDGETSMSTGGENDLVTQLYVHPDYQGRLAKGNYRKTFDIYSLGIVLLEIVRWKHIRDVLELKQEKLSEADVKKVKERLLEPENKHMLRLTEDFGDRVGLAVRSCLEGREAFGIAEGEKETVPETGAKLQRAFMEKVIEPLRDIRL